jgi:hypothetical protein
MLGREVVRSNQEVRELFRQARREGWTAERLADSFMVHIGSIEDATERWEVALFLADEYFQIGDKPLLIHRASGRAIRALTDEDIWQPPPTMRADGTLVERPPMVDPVLMSDLLHFVSELDREQAVFQAIQQRLIQTQYQREEGDTRLQILTREGRDAIVKGIRGEDIKLPSQGSSAAFLSHFQDEAVLGWVHREAPLYGLVVLNIADLRATNIRFDFRSVAIATLGQAWARSLAQAVMVAKPRVKSTLAEAQRKIPEGSTLIGPSWAGAAMVLEGNILLVLAPGVVGAFVIRTSTIQVKHLEISDRIEVEGTAKADMWLDMDRITTFELTSFPTAVSEIVH